MSSQGPLSAGTGATNTAVGTQTWSGASTGVQTQGDSNLAVSSIGAAAPNSNYLQATNFGFSIPAGATIDGIVTEIYRYGTETRTYDGAVKAVKGGTVQSTDLKNATQWPTSSGTGAYATYGGASNLWGTTWTHSDINASNFGVVLAAFYGFYGGGSSATVDHVRTTVYYTSITDPPVAAFSGTPTSGTAPLSVTFTDSSTNFPTSWLWEKNDGSGWVNFASGATTQNPTESFSAGTWSVRLTATNGIGSDDETKTNYLSVVPAPTFPGSWRCRRAVTVSGSNVDSTLTDFPTLVALSADASVGAAARSDGFDIRFTSDSAGTTLLKYERVNWSVSGGAATAQFYVKIPTVTASTGATIYMWYGCAAAAEGADPTNVWDSNFAAVYHLEESGNGTASEFKDSTANARHGRGGNGTGAATPTRTTGQVGYGQSFDGSNDYIQASPSSGFTGQSFTVELWAKQASLQASDIRTMLDYDHAGSPNQGWAVQSQSANAAALYYLIYYDGSGWQPGLGAGVGMAFANTNTWCHLAYTKTGTTLIGYKNGASAWTPTVSSGTVSHGTSRPLGIGKCVNISGREFAGQLDEIRISTAARSAAWIKFTYHNLLGTQVTLGAEQSVNRQFGIRRRSSLRTLRRM